MKLETLEKKLTNKSKEQLKIDKISVEKLKTNKEPRQLLKNKYSFNKLS